MAIHRIEVADPTEGDAIRAALRERGLVVVKRSVDDVTRATEAALVILAADVPGGLDALAALRATAATAVVPVILIGAPEGSGLDAARASLRGADAWFARPVVLERLVRKVETFLAPAESRLRARTDPGVASPPAVRPPSAAPPPVLGPVTGPPAPTTLRLADEPGPERTLRLDAEGKPLAASAIPAPPSSPAPAPASLVRSLGGPTDVSPPRSDTPPRDAQPPPPPTSDISPLLHAVLIAADHRVFPRAVPLDLSFAAGDEPPERLVPDELLEDVGAPFEMPDEDPLESFTHVGPVVPYSGTPMPMRTPSASLSPSRTPGPFTPRSGRFERPSSPTSDVGDLLAPGSGAGVSSSSGGLRGAGADDLELDGDRDAPIVTTTSARAVRGASQVHRRSSLPPMIAQARGSVVPVSDATLGELSRDGHSRSGSVGDAGLVAVFASIALRRIDALLTIVLSQPGTAEARLVVRDGEIRALTGDVARRAVAQLRRERRTAEEQTSEGAAEVFLARLVDSGTLAPFELDRRLGRAREELLFDLLSAPSARFELAPLTPAELDGLSDTARPFARSMFALVVEGARRRLDLARVARLLGPDRVRLVPTAELAAHLSLAGIPPELAALLMATAGSTLDALSDATPAEEGMAGAAYALVCAGSLRVEATGLVREVSVAAVERAKRELAARASIAEDADYFVVLGLARDAQPRELFVAHEAQSRAVRALPLSELGLSRLEPVREAILAALDDALDVLADESLRARYASALDPA